MPPQNFNVPSQQNPISDYHEGKPLWLKIVLALVIALVVFTTAMYVWNHYTKSSIGGTWDENEPEVSLKFNTYTNQQYGFEINYPSDFVYRENPDGVALVAFWYPQALIGEGAGAKIYVRHSDFSSFEDFTKDMIENHIFELVKANNNGSLSDQQAREEVKKFDGEYSFETKKIDNADVLIHKRTFFGIAGSISETYVWIGNGNYILIYGSGLDLNSFKFINTPN